MPTTRTPRVPERIGRYDVERLLGQGGMGRVWLARDTVLGRSVAIKTLRDDLALPPSVKDELVTRMQHEARAAAAVSHPNIVTLHDMGEDDEVGLYLVFEYVAGPRGDGPESLRERLREGPLSLPDVARLARDLGSALTFAHGAGVIHRDVKPENILFSRTGAKIADFGIARIPDSTITRANTVLGTPAYTAPEALAKGDFGPASDQFALAATLYEAATGTRAFGTDDPIVTAGKVSSEPPPPLDAALGTATQVRTLGAALAKGMAKDTGGRFGSCADLGEAVARAIDRPDLPSLETLAARLEGGTPSSDRIEIERTPLSSRVAIAERAARGSDRPSLTPFGDTSRPSILIRKRTHRAQNLIAAAALLVIVALVVIGRKQPQAKDDDGASLRDAARAFASASAASSAGAGAAASVHRTTPRPRPTVHAASGSASASSAASALRAEAGAAAPTTDQGPAPTNNPATDDAK